MDKPVKVLKSKYEIRRFFNNKIVNSEKVVIGGKTMYMTVNKIDDSGKEVKHKKNTKSKIREKRPEMNQTLNFPDDIDYHQSGYPPLHFDKIVESSVNIFFTSPVMDDYFEKSELENPLHGYKKLSKVEEDLFGKISSFSNIEDISDEELINIFHTIQMWGGWEGRRIFFQDGGFEKNFDIETYRTLVSRCLSFEKDGDWVQTVSKWTFESHKSHCKKKGIKGGINMFNMNLLMFQFCKLVFKN